MKKEKNQTENIQEEKKIEDQENINEEISFEKSEVELLKEQNADLNEKLLRSFAEFDNYKKRTQKEKSELSLYTKCISLKEMLPILDNFERALLVECQDESFKKGIEMIFNQFFEAVEKMGLKEIGALNMPFNPEFHNAVNQIEDENFGENEVCQVLQKGYKVDDKVVRHAMVVVANP